MYEAKHQRLLPRTRFYKRIALHVLLAAGLSLFSLGIGMLGFATTEGMPWIDAFLNAAMLLGGMGEIDRLFSFGGKLFAGLFALYAGLVFIICTALILTPVIHRILHYFHVEEKD